MSSKVKMHVLNTGWAAAPEWLLLRGGRLRKIRVPTLVALFRHPEHGWGLFDTGYAPRIFDATAQGPFRLYRVLVSMKLNEEDAVIAQLPGFGLTPADINWILISHFHADHIAGLLDFPNARYTTSHAAYEDVRWRHRWQALRRGFITGMLPGDFRARTTFLGTFEGEELPPFGATHDLFGDGTFRLCNLPGHATGQLGVLVQTTGGPVFFVGDACWLSRSYRENRAPHWITAAFVDSLRQAKNTIADLHMFSTDNPNVPIIPTHCPEAFAQWTEKTRP